MSVKTSKRASTPAKRTTDIRAEYRFDYSRAKPNRFASKAGRNVVAVLLEPDVAAVFKTSKSVNTVLRSVISVMPAASKRKSPGSRKAV